MTRDTAMVADRPPLDAQLLPVVEAMAASAEAKPLATQSVEDVRAGFDLLPLLLGEPEPVAGVHDDVVPGPADPIPVRRYLPDVAGPLPVLVWFHGGGFVLGGLDSHDHLCRALANGAGCAVVAVDYRLAPEHPYPAAVEDAWAALREVVGRAAEWGLDPGRVAVAGDSAGGNLAAVTAVRARDEGGPALRHQLLVYPVTDLRPHPEWPSRVENARGYVLTTELMDWFHDHYLGEAGGADPSASPILVDDLAGVAPATVVVAGYDPLRDEGVAFADRLRAAGVPVSVHGYDGATHLFLQLAPIAEVGRRGLDRVAAELRAAFAS